MDQHSAYDFRSPLAQLRAENAHEREAEMRGKYSSRTWEELCYMSQRKAFATVDEMAEETMWDDA